MEEDIVRLCRCGRGVAALFHHFRDYLCHFNAGDHISYRDFCWHLQHQQEPSPPEHVALLWRALAASCAASSSDLPEFLLLVRPLTLPHELVCLQSVWKGDAESNDQVLNAAIQVCRVYRTSSVLLERWFAAAILDVVLRLCVKTGREVSENHFVRSLLEIYGMLARNEVTSVGRKFLELWKADFEYVDVIADALLFTRNSQRQLLRMMIELFFQDAASLSMLETQVVEAFASIDVMKQPQYVCGVGCSGTLLKRLYQLILSETARGRSMQICPLVLIYVCSDPISLDHARNELADIPHIALLADNISDPEAFCTTLGRQFGVHDLSTVLFLHYFSLPSEDRFAYHTPRMEERSVEYFERWSRVLVGNPFGLVEFECHSIDNSGDSDAIYFDMLCVLSRLQSLPWYLERHAQVGLFADNFMTRASLHVSPCALSAGRFKRALWTIVRANESMLDELVALETSWSSEALHAPKVELARRLHDNPSFNFVLLHSGRVAASGYSQPIAAVDSLLHASYENIGRIVDPQGTVLNLIAVVSLPNLASLRPGHTLISFILELARFSGFRQAAAVTRWDRFAKWKEARITKSEQASPQAYYDLKCDPTVEWHCERGAHVLQLLPRFRVGDVENDGHGVLVSYDLATYSERIQVAVPHQYQSSMTPSTSTVSSLICLASEVTGADRGSISSHTYFFDIFDSLDLFEMRRRIFDQFNSSVPTSIFFTHQTFGQLAEYLCPSSDVGQVQTVISEFINSQASESDTLSNLGLSTANVKTITSAVSQKLGRSISRAGLTRETSLKDFRRILSAPSLNKGSAQKTVILANKERYASVFIGGASVCVSNACSFPELGRLLALDCDLIRPVPTNRRELLGLEFQGGFLDSSELLQLDPLFWGISPREAQFMDPQQKMLLRHTWWAFADAGESAERLQGSNTGVFVGLWNVDFRDHARAILGSTPSHHFGTGVSASIAAGRISYCLGLEGPCMVIDTACSSGLVSFSTAVLHLMNGSCETAISCASNAILSPDMHRHFRAAGMLSTDSRCKTFDALANGYVRSEGCAALQLGTQSWVGNYAEVGACAINQDGRTGGITVPNQSSQEALLRNVLAQGDSSSTLSLVEAHGTGTPLGDPIEVGAIENALPFSPSLPCVLVSIKSSIGHAESVSGLLGISRVLHQFRGRSTKQLHFHTLNPEISQFALQLSSVVIPSEVVTGASVALVNSFAFSGTNSSALIRSLPDGEAARIVLARTVANHLLLAKNRLALESLALSARSWEIECAVPVLCSSVIRRVSSYECIAVLQKNRHSSTGVALFACAAGSNVYLNNVKRAISTNWDVEIPSEALSCSWVVRSARYTTPFGAYWIARLVQSALESWAVNLLFTTTTKATSQESLFHQNSFDSLVSLRQAKVDLAKYPIVVDTGRSSWCRTKQPIWIHALEKRDPNSLQAQLLLLAHLSPNTNDRACGGSFVPLRYPFSWQKEGPDKNSVAAKRVDPGEVCTLAAEVLGFSDAFSLDQDVSFHELGFDSGLIVEFSRKLEQHFGFPVPPSSIFSTPSIRQLHAALTSSRSSTQQRNPNARFQSNHRTAASSNLASVTIAGMACRIAHSSTIQELWTMLESGESVTVQIPESRWDQDLFPEACPWAVLVSNPFLFDHTFFSLSPREASLMDPQQRMVLECSWEVVESASIDPLHLNGSASSVYVGIQAAEYRMRIAEAGSSLMMTATSLACSIAAGRVSYFLGLTGEALAIDTACSSSLVAISSGCKTLLEGQCESSLCFGVNAIFDAHFQLALTKAGMLSTDGRCKTFDASANGYLRGEGCGAVFLRHIAAEKSLSNMEVVSFGVNQDGKSNGLTAPNGSAQEALLSLVAADAQQKIGSVEIVHLEAHGTGTSLGDPIEVRAILGSMMLPHQREPIVLSSSKTLYGHGECAAGIMGVIKTTLSFEARHFPKHLNFSLLNELIGVDTMFSLRAVMPLDSIAIGSSVQHCAGVSSFGMSGTNANVILRRVGNLRLPLRSPSEPLGAVLSAKNNDALTRLCSKSLTWLMLYGDFRHTTTLSNLSSFAWTAQVRGCKDVKSLWNQLQCAQHHQASMSPLPTSEVMVVGYSFLRTVHDCKPPSLHRMQEKDYVYSIEWSLHPVRRDCGANAFSAGVCVVGAEVSLIHHVTQLAASVSAHVSSVLMTHDRDQIPKLASTVVNILSLSKTFSMNGKQEVLLSLKLFQHILRTPNQVKVLLTVTSSSQHVLPRDCTSAVRRAVWSLGRVLSLEADAEQLSHIMLDCDEPDEVSVLFSGQVLPHKAEFACRTGNLFVAHMKKEQSLPERFVVCCDSREQVVITQTQAVPLQGNIEVALCCAYLLKPLGQGEWHFEGVVTRSTSMEVRRGSWVQGSSTKEELCNYLVMPAHAVSTMAKAHSRGLVFSIRHLGDALRTLRTTGKAVTITFPQVRENARGACIVTGAFGQLGLLYSQWLLSSGESDHIVMMGRGGMMNEQRAMVLAERAFVTSVRVDVANEIHCVAAIGHCRLGQIGHIAHIAGVLKDEWMVNVSSASLAKVFAPKARGLRWIAQLLARFPAATATLFSSIASSLGNYGQASYAAANGFMDGFAERTFQAVSIAWGPWETGMYASLQQTTSKRLPTLSPQDSAEIFSMMHRSLCRGTLSAVMKIETWGGLEGLYLGDSFLTRSLVTAAATTASATTASMDQGSAGMEQHSAEQVDRVVVKVMVEALGVEREEDIGPDTPFSDLGVDSIMTIQITAQLSKLLGKSFQPTLLFNNPTLSALRKRLILDITRSASDFLAVVSPLRRSSGQGSDEVKVVGAACRFSNASSLAELWSRIFSPGADAVRACPRERWALHGQANPYDAGYLEGGTEFDADFFKISPREALLMDPQHRLTLECGWDSIESAGVDPLSLRGTHTGVYLGIQMGEYATLLTDEVDIFAATGIAPAAAAGRLAYFLDLRGQAVAIDTACSSSLVALTQGSDAIWFAKEEMMASYSICMGVQMLFSPDFFDKFRAAGMLSPDSRCKSFDQSANGYVRAEGCGSVLLSRGSAGSFSSSSSSIAVVSAVANQDGRTNGLTAPSGTAQAELLRRAVRFLDGGAHRLHSIEAHGTGTSLGDPIEMQAIVDAFGGNPSSALVVGCAKTNLGHCETAAGVFGVLKTLCSMQNLRFSKNLHFRMLNLFIGSSSLEQSAIVLPLETIDWSSQYAPEWLAGISSFGYSGTNAHVVLRAVARMTGGINGHNSDWAKKNVVVREIFSSFLLLSSTTRVSTNRKVFFPARPPLGRRKFCSAMEVLHVMPVADPVFPVYDSTMLLSQQAFPESADNLGIVHIGIYLELITFCLKSIKTNSPWTLNLEFLQPLLLSPENEVAVHVRFEPEAERMYVRSRLALNNGAWVTHVEGRWKPSPLASFVVARPAILPHVLSGVTFYDQMRARNGMEIGKSVKWLDEIRFEGNYELIVARMRAFDQKDWADQMLPVPRGMIDACAQLLLLGAREETAILTRRLDDVEVSPFLSPSSSSSSSLVVLWAVINMKTATEARCTLMTEEGFVCVRFTITVSVVPKLKALLGQVNVLENLATSDQIRQAALRILCDAVTEATGASLLEAGEDVAMSDLGIDSLTRLYVVGDFLRKTGIDISHALLVAVSLRDVIDQVVVHSLKARSSDDDHDDGSSGAFFSSPRTAACVVYCLPFGGGDSSVYRDWGKQLALFCGEVVQVCPIHLPGARLGSSSTMISADHLVAKLADAISRHAGNDGRIMLYGHSFGGLLAFCCAVALMKKGRECSHLFVGAMAHPLASNPMLERYDAMGGPSISPSQFFEAFSDIVDPEYLRQLDTRAVVHRESLVSIFHADFALIKDLLGHFAKATVTCAITGFYSTSGDPAAPSYLMEGWKARTSSSFQLVPVPIPGHIFINHADARRVIMEKIRDEAIK